MALNHWNSRILHRRTYAGNLLTVTLLKRGNDQAMGTVTSYTLYQCRIRRRYHTGEPLSRSLASGDRSEWRIPVCELARVGVDYLNALDRIVDQWGHVWQPESTENLDIHLFDNLVNVPVRRVPN